MTRSVLFALFALAAAGSAAAQSPALAGLDFMAGCWRSSPDERGTRIEEHYTQPSTNLILGMTRYLRDGATRGFEFSRIQRADSAVILTPHPNGIASVGFRLAQLEGDHAIFENPAHDFPQRIRYRRDGAELVARIEDMAGEGQEWRMMRCAPD